MVVAVKSLNRCAHRLTVECPRVPVPSGFVDSVVVVNRNRATVGGDGSIWIRPMRAIGDSLEYWVRADPKAGTPGDFELPPRARLMSVVDGSRIWVMQMDADDLPSLTRYRIAPTSDR
jgi:hypothetical protein